MKEKINNVLSYLSNLFLTIVLIFLLLLPIESFIAMIVLLMAGVYNWWFALPGSIFIISIIIWWNYFTAFADYTFYRNYDYE